ncbi:MAG: pilus assembly PilX N-terminal domain-containing protein [Candidatus Omnitrophota bacterium]|nr:pilus assembly PilX N-terminal domain-containing protein [Candidatus Omnitrophota bacterium]
MDKRKGVVLVFSLLVTLVLSILLAALYLKAVNENQLANRYINSMRAFWLAEAGIATVKANPGLSGVGPEQLGGDNYTFSAIVQPVLGTNNYWTVTSIGTVSLPSGPSISRTLTATVKTAGMDSSKFPYAIDTTAELEIHGSAVTINGTYKEEDNTINFTNMFGISKTTMKADAAHLYTDSTFNTPVDGITWVDVSSGHTLDIAGNLNGSGILVINGNAKFSGTVIFNGIIYVIGTLTMTGNVTTNGAIVAESSAQADTTLAGSVNISFNLDQIEDALSNVQFLSKQIVAWREA